MTKDIALFTQGSAVSALQAYQAAYTGGMVQVSGGFTPNRISFKNSRFARIIVGKDIETIDSTFIDVIVVAAIPTVSRVYYPNSYESSEKAQPPACWSTDGVAPDSNVQDPVDTKCDACPMNEKGSGNGGRGRGCGFRQRLMVIFDGDETLTPYQVDLPATAIFGKADGANQFRFQELARMLDQQKCPLDALVLRWRFDPKADGPSVLNTPHRILAPDERDFIRAGLDMDLISKSTTRIVDGVSENSGQKKARDATPASGAAGASPPSGTPGRFGARAGGASVVTPAAGHREPSSSAPPTPRFGAAKATVDVTEEAEVTKPGFAGKTTAPAGDVIEGTVVSAGNLGAALDDLE